MGKIQIPKKIRVEDFNQDQQDFAGKLSLILTNFMDDVYNTLNGGVDFNNLNRQLVDVVINIDGAGKIINPPQVKLTTTKVRGVNVVNAINLINPGAYPLQLPFVAWTSTNTTLNILNVSGLPNGSQYSLTLELMG